MLNNSLRSTFCHYTFFLIYVSSLVNREFFYFWIEHWTSTILLLSIVYNAQKPSMFYGSYQKKKCCFLTTWIYEGFENGHGQLQLVTVSLSQVPHIDRKRYFSVLYCFIWLKKLLIIGITSYSDRRHMLWLPFFP